MNAGQRIGHSRYERPAFVDLAELLPLAESNGLLRKQVQASPIYHLNSFGNSPPHSQLLSYASRSGRAEPERATAQDITSIQRITVRRARGESALAVVVAVAVAVAAAITSHRCHLLLPCR